MKILALCDFQCDFLAETVLTGLHETGHDIFEMPTLNHVRGGVDEGYYLTDTQTGMTGTSGYLKPNPLPPYTHTREELFDSLREKKIDLIVMLSGRDYTNRAFIELKGWFGRDHLPPIVLCDGEDAEGSSWNYIDSVKPVCFFKREMLKSISFEEYNADGIGVFPLQFGAFLRSLPNIDDMEKDYDISLSLGRTWPMRDELITHFLNAAYGYRVCPPERAWIATNSNSPLVQDHLFGDKLHDLSEWSVYMARQGKSKITACPRGWGRDTMHAWEAFSFATFVLYLDPGLHIPYPFEDGIHCYYLREDEIPSIGKILSKFLAMDEWRTKIAKAGRDHCRKFHSTLARAQYLLDISSKILGGEKIEKEEYGL